MSEEKRGPSKMRRWGLLLLLPLISCASSQGVRFKVVCYPVAGGVVTHTLRVPIAADHQSNHIYDWWPPAVGFCDEPPVFLESEGEVVVE